MSEAAALSDVFIFRLMFRMYRVPRTLRDQDRMGAAEDSAFFERKRLLDSFAVKKSVSKEKRSGGAVEFSQYLMLSAMPLRIPAERCTALDDKNCSIYERRPISCRSVPLHYSAPEADALATLSEFSRRSGHQCDTSDDAPIIVENGRIVSSEILTARGAAMDARTRDEAWSQAIVKRMKCGESGELSLPTFQQIEANAGVGAMTISMLIAWHIAVEEGLMDLRIWRDVIGRQLSLIERELILARGTDRDQHILAEMRDEYRLALAQP